MRFRLTAVIGALLGLVLAFPAPALAHAELVSASPEDGANLDEPPTQVVLTFDAELDPERSEFIVTDASAAEVGSGDVDLEVADRNELRGDVEISEPGVYVVSWTAVAGDGHAESGELRFGYRTDVGATAAEQPNTATTPPAARWPILAGIASLLAAAASTWRVGRREASPLEC